MEKITFSGGVDNFAAFVDRIINDSEWQPYGQEGMCWGEITVCPALKPAKPGRGTWQVITFDALGSITGMGTIEAYEELPGQTSIVLTDGVTHPPIGQPFYEFAEWLAGQLPAPAEPNSSQPTEMLRDRPPPPASEAPWDQHFDWYEKCKKQGFYVTLEDVAKNKGRALSTVNTQRGLYKAEKDG